MATDEEQMRQHILAQATRSIPKAFLMEVLDRIRRAYLKEFSAVAHNVATLAEQRIFKLNQDPGTHQRVSPPITGARDAP